MKRRLLNLFSAVSLLLCVAACALWVRSYGSSSAPAPSAARMQDALARPLPVINFDGVALDEIVQFTGDVSRATMEVDWPALAAAGVGPDTPVSLRVQNRPIGEVLARSVSAAGDLGYRVRGSVIRVSTRAALGAQGTAPPVLPPASDTWERVVAGRRWTVSAHRGNLHLWVIPADMTSVYQQPEPKAQAVRAERDRQLVNIGSFSVVRRGYPYCSWLASAPLWAFAAATAVGPLMWLRARARSARRRRRNQCPGCGYDLTGNASGVCPECGTPATKPV
jgi:hypothetical protein